MDYKEEK